MEKKTEEENKGIEKNGWKEIVQTFVANIAARASDNISEKIQEWFNNVKRRTIGALLISMGVVFILICLAIYINTIVNNGSQWAGYGVVGMIVFLAGYFMVKERK